MQFAVVVHCGRCTPRCPDVLPEDPGQAFSSILRRKADVGEESTVATGALYSIPRIGDRHSEQWAPECMTWPRYHQGVFSLESRYGDSMLELTEEERRALRIVVLRTTVKKERFGATHQYNWKKVGLSMAYFREGRITYETLPTIRAKAASTYLLTNNKSYKIFADMHNRILNAKEFFTISSFDLFITHTGIECAIWPWLYPQTKFSDTGLYTHYKEESGDDTSRIVSIAESWTRKVLSSVRVFGEQRDLPFFLYEVWTARKYFAAHTRAQRMQVTADIMVRDSQSSSGYWEIVRDALADLVRIMLERCYDEANHPMLYKHVRTLRGEVWLCAFPNLFITIAPAEWTFPRPYFLQPYLKCVFAGAYVLALHMFFLVRCVWRFLSSRLGHKYFVVLEYVCKTEYQGIAGGRCIDRIFCGAAFGFPLLVRPLGHGL